MSFQYQRQRLLETAGLVRNVRERREFLENLCAVIGVIEEASAETTRVLLSALATILAEEDANSVVRELLLRIKIVRPLVQLLLNRKHECAELALQVLRELSLMSQGRQEIVENRAVLPIVAFIGSDHEEVRTCALRTIFNLSVVSPEVRMQIIEAGALPTLVHRVTLVCESQCAVVGTIANLATEAQTKRAIVFQFKALRPILQVLQGDDIGVLTHACRALFALAANDQNKAEIREAGGIPLLLDCMNTPCDSVRMNAAGALANLAIHPSNKTKLVEAGILPYLRFFASSDNIKIKRQIARCLFALAAHPGNRGTIIQENCLPAIVHLMHCNNFEVQLNAAGAIGNIAMTDEYKGAVVSSGALARLLELATAVEPKVQRQAARSVFTLSAKDSIKKVLVEMNGVECLLQMCEVPFDEIRRDTAGALANIAIGNEYKRFLIEKGALPPLAKLLQTGSVCVQRQATRAIFALAGNKELQAKIIQAGILPLLSELLMATNEDIQKHTAGAFANFANHHPKEIIATGQLGNILTLAVAHPVLDVRRQALRTVSNLVYLDGTSLREHNQRQQSMLDLSKYAGPLGETQRLRVDMRKLFEATLHMQTKASACFLERDDFHVENSCSSANTKSSSAAETKKGRKRSCEDLLIDFHPFANKARGCRKEKQTGLDHDVRLVLPLSAHSPTEEAKSSCESWMGFLGHAAILSARSEVLADAIEGAMKRGDTTRDGELCVRVCSSMASSEQAWLALLEYLYTDALRVHVKGVQKSSCAASELNTLAQVLKLPRLAYIVSQLTSRDKEKVRDTPSTWVSDMCKLLDTDSSSLPNLTDIDMKLSPEFANSCVPNPSPRHSNFTFPGSPKNPDSPTKRMKTVDSTSNRTMNVPRFFKPEARFSAHKVILAARCKYFAARFKKNWSFKDSSVVFSGTEEALMVILKYIYCGMDRGLEQTLREDPSLALQVLVIANEYSLDGLQLQCEYCLLKWVNDSTILVLLQELELVHAPILRTACVYHFLKSGQRLYKDSLKAGIISPSLAKVLQVTAARWGLETSPTP